MKFRDKSYRSFRYYEVWEITEWKDGCVYKAISKGHIRSEDKEKFPSDKFVLSSVSTSLCNNNMMELQCYEGPEVNYKEVMK